ncbi:MAG: hypothetical protein ACRC67_37655 [Inquilinus sp.]|uniref:hypothetical protein n=1 Tax=Inquilinus sp. TaxID=1932117 RepID=UPI003F381B02
MGEDCNRPTLTYDDRAFNPTQVRLYGIEARGGGFSRKKPQDRTLNGVTVSVTPSRVETDADAANFKALVEELKKKYKKSEEEIIFDLIKGRYDSEIQPEKAGFDTNGYASQLDVNLKDLGLLVVTMATTIENARIKRRIMTCGIIVGYAYEGHCYDLPKPKVMIIPDHPRIIPVDDCGYKEKEAELYRMWIVDKLDDCVEFEINQGFVEQLVLEANLPGKRSPTAYVGRYMLGHRSGRLTD